MIYPLIPLLHDNIVSVCSNEPIYFVFHLGMVLNINLGFTNLQKVNVEDPQDCNYALYIGDTIILSEHSGVTELTGHSKKKINSVCIFFGEEESNDLDQVQERIYLIIILINLTLTTAALLGGDFEMPQ